MIMKKKKYNGSAHPPSKKKYKPSKKFRSRKPTSKSGAEASEEKGIRLNKYIANAGICSRREADQLIETGVVKVNGKIVQSMGFRVQPADRVVVEGQKIKSEPIVYVLLNKPKDHITTSKDPGNRKTVMHLAQSVSPFRLYPIGRLERNATGLILLTNDGYLTQKMTNNAFKIKQIYHLRLDKNLKSADRKKLQDGIIIDGFKIMAQEVSYLEGKPKSEIGLEMWHIKSNVIRKLFKTLDYDLIKIDRVNFGGLVKKKLNRGNARLLKADEIKFLKMQIQSS